MVNYDNRVLFLEASYKRFSTILATSYLMPFEWKVINRVLIDNGTTVNVLPLLMRKQFCKDEKDLIWKEAIIINFVGEATKARSLL